jgi:hypothetical protein
MDRHTISGRSQTKQAWFQCSRPPALPGLAGVHARRSILFLSFVLTLLLVSLPFAGTALAQTNQLFSFLDGTAAASLSQEQEHRVAAVAADKTLGPAQLIVANAQALAHDAVRVPLPSDGTLSLRLEHRLDRGPDDFTWIGRPESAGGQSVLVVRNGEITGIIHDGPDQYSITPLGGGLHAIAKIDQSAFPADHPPGPLPRAPRDANEQRGDVSGSSAIEIDFLGAYTPEALAANGNIVNTIQLAVDMANAAYLASNANVQLRLVGTMLTTGYSEAGKSYNDLLNDVTNGSGAMSAVHTQRNALGADLVGLFVNHLSYCGLAWVESSNDYAYSVTTHVCVNGHTFAHELGHNFGALHDIANSGGGTPPFLYGYGYIHPQNQWRTIQSYGAPCGNCPRIGHFSNPNVNYNGEPTGTITQHDVARVHRERAATIAAFRASVAGTKAAITSPAPGVTLAGSTVTFQWSAGTGAQAYWLYVGDTVGGFRYHNTGQLGTGTLSREVIGLPTNGSTVHVRLYTMLAGVWQFNDYTYTAVTLAGTKAAMTSPTPGATLAGSTVTFQWNAGTSAQAYWLYVGSSLGGRQYHDSGQLGTGTRSHQVTGLPADGSTVRVRLWTRLAGLWQSNDYTYTAAPSGGTKAVMASPAPSSTLPGSTVTFQWNAGSQAEAYVIYVGTVTGGFQFLHSGQLSNTTLSRQVTGLPTDGSTVYVRLYTRLAGLWQFNDYTYTAAAGAAGRAAMTSPTQGSTLAGSTVTFQWSAGTGAQAYWLYVGSTVGGAQYHDSGQLSTGTLSRQVTGLPTHGLTVRVRLFTRLAGVWEFNDYVYTAVNIPGTKAAITSPTPGSTLAGSTVTFQWNTGTSATAYMIYVGSTVGGSQYHDSSVLSTATLSRQVTALPTDGSIVHIRLFTQLAGVWQFNDYSYTAATSSGTKAAITSPAPGSTLAGSTVTFQWNAGSQAQSYWLYVGNTVGGFQYHDSGQLSSATLSRQVTGLPTDGSTVRVRLYTRLAGVWEFNDYSYTAAAGGGTKAAMVAPVSGSTLPGTAVTFRWSTGVGVTQYWLEVGTTPGGTNLFNASTGTNTWRNVAGLPTAGTIYVRLWSLIGGAWQFNDYSYTGGGANIAAMTAPTPGSTLGSTSVTFAWSAGTGVSQYWLEIGTTPGGTNLFNASTGTNTSQTVTGLPTTGTLFVRLWSLQGGVWRVNDYVYVGMSGVSSASFSTDEPTSTQSAL